MATKLPHGPKSPAWWQLTQWMVNPLGYQRQCAQKYGDIFSLNMIGFPPFVVIGHPVGIQEIFNQEPNKFDTGRSNQIARPLLGDNSILLYDGERHQRERKLLMPPFHGQNLQSYSQAIAQITAKVTGQWSSGQQIVAREAMQQITLEIIMQVVFGISSGERYQQLKPLLAKMLDATDSPLRSSFLFLKFLQQDWGNWSFWGQFMAQRREIDRLLQAEIDSRRCADNLQRNDVLSLMMLAEDETGQGMSDAELKDEVKTLLIAGHETTATILAWAIYELLRHPQVLAKLRGELKDISDFGALEVAKLPYLNAICQEVLRLYPVIPIILPRITKTAMTIMGHDFAPETWLTPSIYLVHYREDLYPEPNKFQPERFLHRQYSPYEFLPFGGANRRCLGAALAQLELKLVLAYIVAKYDLSLVSKQPSKPQRRGLTISPQGGIPVMVQ